MRITTTISLGYSKDYFQNNKYVETVLFQWIGMKIYVSNYKELRSKRYKDHALIKSCPKPT